MAKMLDQEPEDPVGGFMASENREKALVTALSAARDRKSI